MAKKKAKKKLVNDGVAKKRRVGRPAKRVAKKQGNLALAIIGLILNIIIIPGLGSLIVGRIRTGIWQMIVSVTGLILLSGKFGIPILAVAWVWGLITGIIVIQKTG